MATHYAEVENMYRKMRGWRHDYRNHIQVLKSYADMGALDELRRYLDELGNDLDTVDLKYCIIARLMPSYSPRESGTCAPSFKNTCVFVIFRTNRRFTIDRAFSLRGGILVSV